MVTGTSSPHNRSPPAPPPSVGTRDHRALLESDRLLLPWIMRHLLVVLSMLLWAIMLVGYLLLNPQLVMLLVMLMLRLGRVHLEMRLMLSL